MKQISAIMVMALGTGLLATPALACEFHSGGWFSVPSSQWQNFSPTANAEDPSLMEDGTMTPLPAKAAKPSFSDAANRASRAAKQKLAMNGDETAEKTVDEKKAEAKRASLEANAQAIR